MEVVYFVVARLSELGALDAVKVGRSVLDPSLRVDPLLRRIRSIQVGCPSRVELLRCIEGGAAQEYKLHRKWASHRLRGEWFRLDPIAADIFRLPGRVLIGVDRYQIGISRPREKPNVTSAMLREARSSGLKWKEIASHFGIPLSTAYCRAKLAEGGFFMAGGGAPETGGRPYGNEMKRNEMQGQREPNE